MKKMWTFLVVVRSLSHTRARGSISRVGFSVSRGGGKINIYRPVLSVAVSSFELLPQTHQVTSSRVCSEAGSPWLVVVVGCYSWSLAADSMIFPGFLARLLPLFREITQLSGFSRISRSIISLRFTWTFKVFFLLFFSALIFIKDFFAFIWFFFANQWDWK